MKALIKLLNGLIGDRFYGELVIKFEAGQIVCVRESKNHDPKAFLT
jgi:hypothetical protein